MDEHCALLAKLVAELADRLEERQALDVADGAANLAQHEILAMQVRRREFLDGVGDVRDDLHGAAEIVAAALLADDVGIDPAGRHVIGLGRGDAGKAFIMA